MWKYILLITFGLWASAHAADLSLGEIGEDPFLHGNDFLLDLDASDAAEAVNCTAEEIKQQAWCDSCAQPMRCDEGKVVKGNPCDLIQGKTCGVFEYGGKNISLCLASPSPECDVCKEKETFGACDKKDKSLIIFCNGGKTSGSLECPDGKECSDHGKKCSGSAPSPDKDPICGAPGMKFLEIMPFTPDCKEYGMCQDAHHKPLYSTECKTENEYFDPVVGHCVAGPYVPCRGVVDSAPDVYPDLTDPKKYLVCNGTEKIAQFKCPTVFNAETKACGTDSSKADAPLEKCSNLKPTSPPSTTTKPTTN